MPYVIKLGIEKLIKGTKEGAQKTHTHTQFLTIAIAFQGL